MSDKQINYFYDADAGIELIKHKNSNLSYPLHNHASVFTIIMILSGNIRLTLGKQNLRLYEHQVLAIPPYLPHSINADSQYTMISLCIHKDIIKQISKNRLIFTTRSLLNKAFYFEPIDAKQMTLLLNAVVFCKRHAHKPITNVDYVERLKQLIEQRPEYNLTAVEMSRYAHISKYHLIRSFKQSVGLTPRQFQIQNRIRKAQRLLTQPLSLTEVALAVGFFDQSHFIKHFKKIVRLTPSYYKSVFATIKAL